MRLQDTKAAREIQALQDFYDMLGSDSARAFYGPGHVWAAPRASCAIQMLLITDTLFRVNDVGKRRRYAMLVEEVQEGGGKVFIFSGEPRLRAASRMSAVVANG